MASRRRATEQDRYGFRAIDADGTPQGAGEGVKAGVMHRAEKTLTGRPHA